MILNNIGWVNHAEGYEGQNVQRNTNKASKYYDAYRVVGTDGNDICPDICQIINNAILVSYIGVLSRGCYSYEIRTLERGEQLGRVYIEVDPAGKVMNKLDQGDTSLASQEYSLFE